VRAFAEAQRRRIYARRHVFCQHAANQRSCEHPLPPCLLAPAAPQVRVWVLGFVGVPDASSPGHACISSPLWNTLLRPPSPPCSASAYTAAATHPDAAQNGSAAACFRAAWPLASFSTHLQCTVFEILRYCQQVEVQLRGSTAVAPCRAVGALRPNPRDTRPGVQPPRMGAVP